MSYIQIDFWQLIGIAATVFSAVVAAGWLLIVIIVKQFTARLDERFKAQEELRVQRELNLENRFKFINEANSQERTAWRNLERDMLEFKALMPLEYVRREDSIRAEVVFHAKLDAVAAKIDALRAGG